MSELSERIRQGDRRALGQLITALESSLEDRRAAGAKTLNELMPHTGNSLRIGISGVPGVGKSTFIEAFGMDRIADGYKVAVLAVDPSSPISGGSILGDRTRMTELSSHQHTFIRPSPTSGTLGGVARHTREAILAVEAAGYDLIIVETVGVGQSEALAASMVDAFVILHLPNSGDELQGIKKGVLELADFVVVTKCDGNYEEAARQSAVDIKQAMSLTRGQDQWTPPVLTASAVTKKGLDLTWQEIKRFEDFQKDHGLFDKRRKAQAKAWFDDEFDHAIIEKVRSASQFEQLFGELLVEVQDSKTSANIAASQLAEKLLAHLKP